MVKKAFLKTVFRAILSNKGRFLINFFIVFLSTAITSGLGALTSTFSESYSTNYSIGNCPDINLKCKEQSGFKQEDFEYLESVENFAELNYFTSFDTKKDDVISRFYFLNLSKKSIAKLTLDSGKYPSSFTQILVERSSLNLKKHEPGESIKINTSTQLDQLSFVISGIVHNPMYNTVAKERAFLDSETPEYINEIFYIDTSLAPSIILSQPFPVTDIYVRFNITHNFVTNDYDSKVSQIKEKLKTHFNEEYASILTLKDTTSYSLYEGYNEKIDKISYIFPLFFLILCGLVNSLIITRLISDERSQIGCYHSLGINKKAIIFKYLTFSTLGTLLGCLIGYFIGTPTIPLVIFNAYNAVFYMGPFIISFKSLIGCITAALLILISASVTIYFSRKYLKETPSNLFRPASFKPGKSVLIEKVSFIWKRLSFSYKSSVRNIFRQKKNSILTTFAVIGSTLLVLIGFSLLNVSNHLKGDSTYGNVASSMGVISAVIVIFALLMAISVVYALANMNISERVREIATLKVLGYTESECSLYTFREIFIITVFAVILGLPISTAIIAGVLEYLEFGNISEVEWYSYIATFFIIILSTFIVNLILIRRIHKIDMNGSLKSIE